MRFTLLEGVALLAVLICAPRSASTWSAALRRAPIFLVASYAGAQLLSAAATDVAPGRSFRFALRSVALAVLALVVACAPAAARRRSIGALAAGGFVVAALAVAEGHGVRALDPWLGAFREQPFNVGD